MKGRKNIFKVALTSVLSVAMCLSGAIAVKSVMPAKAFAEDTVETKSIVNNVTYSGSNASVGYGENTDGTGKSFTGLKLTGGTGATFNLGTIDLSKSYWNGVDMTYGTEQSASDLTDAAKAEMQLKGDGEAVDYNKFLYDESETNYNSKYFYDGSDAYANFIAFAFAPHVDRYKKTDYDIDTTGTPKFNYKELKDMTITLTDADGNCLTIKTTEQSDTNATGGRKLGVGGDGQKTGGMRKFSPANTVRLYEGLRVQMSDVGGADQVPYQFCYNQNWSAASEEENNPALYSPNGSGAAPTIAGTWLIRKFAKTSYVDNSLNDTNAWYGFSSSKVNVTVKFDNVQTVSDKNDASVTNGGVTSLVITSLGGFDLTKAEQTLTDGDYFGAAYNSKNPTSAMKGEAVTLYAPVKTSTIASTAIVGSKVEIYDRDNALEKTVTFTAETAEYAFGKTGAYTLKWYDDDENLIKTTTVNVFSAKVNVETDIIGNMSTDSGKISYITDKKQVSVDNMFSGIRLTGKTGTKFDLGTFKLDNNKMYWNGNAVDTSSVITDVMNYYSGSNDSDKAANAENATSYGSFFSYVYDTASTDFELTDLSIRLEQVDKPTNYIQLYTNSYKDSNYNIIFVGQGTNNDAYACERSNSGALTIGNHLRSYKSGSATRPIDLVWDNEKATVYANTTYATENIGGYGTWAIRQFKNSSDSYTGTAYTDKGLSPWEGFDDGAELKCTVTFAKSSVETSIIVTSLGGVDLTSATYNADMTAVTEDAETIAGAEINLLDTVYLTDGLATVTPKVTKVTVQKGEEAAVEAENAEAYAFDEQGVYTVTYYDGEEVLGASTYTVKAITLTLNLTNGKLTKADGTEVTADTELALDDELTFTPAGEMTTLREKTLTFDTVRSLTVNGAEITAATKKSEYTFKVGDYISGATLSVEAKGDTELNIYVTDSRKDTVEEKVASVWATDGSYQFAGYRSVDYQIQDHFKELSDGSFDMLMGFGRYEYVDGKQVRIGGAPFLTKQPLSAYAPYNNIASAALDKDNYFEALWLNIKTSFQIRVGENDGDSGMRLVTEIKTEDIERYNVYNGSGLGMIVRTNLTTLNHLQQAKGANFDIKSIRASHWMTGGWDPVAGKANNLGLYAPGDDAAGKPLFYQYGDNKMLKELNKMVSGVTEGYTGYAITLVNFREENIDFDYVFQSTWTCDGVTGGATGCVGYAKQGKMKDLATAAYGEAFGAELGGEYQYTVTVNGETKYSKYTADRLQWLVKMAGMTESVTVGA